MNSEAKGAQPSLSYVIHAMGMPFNGNTLKTQSLGGSESAAYYQAQELARRGHKVLVFTTHQEELRDDAGVTWAWCGQSTQAAPLGERFEHYARNTPHDVLIIQRASIAFHKPFASKVNLWQLHDLALHRSAPEMMAGLWQVDAVTTVSEWHKQQVREVWDLNDKILQVVPNGVDPTLYTTPLKPLRLAKEGEKFGRVRKLVAGSEPNSVEETTELVLPSNRFILLYQSRPERGLEHLVRPGGIMDRCQSLPVHLVVCGYDNTVPQMVGYYNQLAAWGNALPNVSHLGALTKAELANLQRQCDLMVYPTEFEEVSCITAMEAMHASLPLLTSRHAALPETCEGSGTALIDLKDGKADEDAFCGWLHSVFGRAIPGYYPPELHDDGYPSELQDLRSRQRAAAKQRTWAKAVDHLEGVVFQAQRRRHSIDAIVRNAIEHSDIAFADWVLRQKTAFTDTELAFTSPILYTAKQELGRLYYDWVDDPVKYAAHYAKHQTAYYDEFEERVVGEDVTGSTRFRGVLSLLGTAFSEHPRRSEGLRVLDYGCAHGHYTIPLAKAFPTCDFLGVDISTRAVAAATKWRDRDAVPNAEFRQGDQAVLDPDQLGHFDVVLACEVVEHVWDYYALLSKFQGLLAPGGCLIVTTPHGRWEHSGTVPFRTAREHLHHFDKADIEDICGAHRHQILHAPASQDRSGWSLGSWVWAVWPTAGVPLWKVNYNRKFREYVPRRQTISVCMIAKNAEKTLRSCVESFIDWVDEVIVSVDPTTTDRTDQIVLDLAKDFPNRTIIHQAGVSAMEVGFDEARNWSMSGATGDWVMWCDADEEVRQPWMLQTLARPSHHNGYGFAQVHYSAAPPQVLTTDYPCRYFRNKLGIKFYGVVHEHPELVFGEAVKYSLVRPDVQFLHMGYVDEETRRKRYQRNLPLLHRDREKHPERVLNKFLMLRDIAQGIMFEAEQIGGLAPEHGPRGQEGIALMTALADQPQVRMIADALPYYSQCVMAAGVPSFEAEIDMKTAKPEAPGLSVSLNLKGRFHSREFYLKLVRKLTEESTKQYESRYL